MKKIKKIVSILAAAATMAMVTFSAFAAAPFDIVNVDRQNAKLILSYEGTNSTRELWIDENYDIVEAQYFTSTAAVRMVNGEQPPALEGENLVVQKLSNIEKLNVMSIETVWFMDLEDIEMSDDLYAVSGFSSAEAVEEYCQNLVVEGQADYAKPITGGEYSYVHPASLTGYEDDLGLSEEQTALFSKDLFTFAVGGFADGQASIEYLNENISGFEESISVAVCTDSAVYFQFMDTVDGDTWMNILSQMNDLETIGTPFLPVFMYLASDVTSDINEIPDDYLLGDTDKNNVVDLYDVIAIAEYLIDMRTFDESELVLADYDGNGTVDLYDAIAIAETLI